MRLRDRKLLLLCATISAILSLAVPAIAAVELNEVRNDNPGTDTDEYFEIKGTPGTNLTGYTFIIIGDASTAPRCGYVEAVVDIGSLASYTIPGDGYYAVCRTAGTLGGYDVTGVTALNMENDDHFTYLLVQGWSGALGNDLDTNDDGVLDSTPWTTLVDCIGFLSTRVIDCSTGAEYVYCATTVGGGNASPPMHAWRCEDTRAWMVGDNNLYPIGVDSPGGNNQTCLLPSPSIKMEWRTPCAPAVTQAATVTDSITGSPTSAKIYFQVNGGATDSVSMVSIGSDKWQGSIPGQAVNGTRISYYVKAFNAQGSDQGYNWGYFVGTVTVASLRVNDINGSNIYRYYGVNVAGNVTAAQGTFSPTNTDFWFQDATGGLKVFQFGKVVASPALGDDIEVMGQLGQYNGVLEIESSSACGDVQVTINGAGSPPAPLLISSCDMGEDMEGFLVRLQFPLIDTALAGSYGGTTGGTWRSNRNYKMTNCYPDTSIMFVDGDTNIDGTPVVTTQLDLTGIAGQYDSTSPYTGMYQVMPRGLSDIIYVTPADAGQGAPDLKARLFPCAPNPFSATTRIAYQIPKSGGAPAVPVRINLYDVAGRKVATLLDGLKEPGAYSLTLDAGSLGGIQSGIFFYELVIDGRRIDSRKLVLSR